MEINCQFVCKRTLRNPKNRSVIMSNRSHEKVIIIGAGAAGLTAGIYTARANMSPVILAGLQPGGQMTITTDVENYPGFAEVIQGPWLMQEMQSQAENVGARVIYDIVTTVDARKHPFVLTLDSGSQMTADALIVATGAQARWLGLETETTFNGRGVSACATCDGFFYRDRDVAVIGGGNTAVEEALYLANICKSVTLIHRRDSLRAEQIMQDRLLRNEKINVEWNRTVEEVLGDDGGVTGLRLASTVGQAEKVIEVHGMFVAIGHDPATAAFKDVLDMDDEGYILAEKGGTRTSVAGIFAAGDCVDKIYRQAVTAAGMGCMAALDAERWLGEQE
jgi:thioredoxin reductase (NADPH)